MNLSVQLSFFHFLSCFHFLVFPWSDIPLFLQREVSALIPYSRHLEPEIIDHNTIPSPPLNSVSCFHTLHVCAHLLNHVCITESLIPWLKWRQAKEGTKQIQESHPYEGLDRGNSEEIERGKCIKQKSWEQVGNGAQCEGIESRENNKFWRYFW